MEQKDKTRKEELLKDFEEKWELEQDLLMSREGRESLPTYYAAEKKMAMQFILPEYYSEIEKAFDAVPSRALVGEKKWENSFLNIAKEKLADTYVFFKKVNDVDQKNPLCSPILATRDTIRWRDAFLDRLFRIAKKYDEDPVRSSLSDEHIYSVVLQAGLLDHAGVIDKYKDTGRADVLLWGVEKNLARLKEDEGLKWLSESCDDNDLKALYLYAAMAHDHRTGKIQEAMYPEFYLINKIEEASRHDFEYIDEKYDHDDNMFCDRIATMMDYFQECFTPVFPNLRNMDREAEPYGMTPILGSVLKVAKERDEKLLQDSVFVKTHPTLAAIIHRRLALSFDNGVPFSAVDGKSEEMTLRKYGEQIMQTANAFLIHYYKQTEMSDEEKTEVEDQLKGFEKLGNRFDHRFFDLKPEPYGYASWPKEYQFIRSSSNQTNQNTPTNTEPTKPTGQKTSDAAKPSRLTGCLHKNDPKTRGR